MTRTEKKELRERKINSYLEAIQEQIYKKFNQTQDVGMALRAGDEHLRSLIESANENERLLIIAATSLLSAEMELLFRRA